MRVMSAGVIYVLIPSGSSAGSRWAAATDEEAAAVIEQVFRRKMPGRN